MKLNGIFILNFLCEQKFFYNFLFIFIIFDNIYTNFIIIVTISYIKILDVEF